MRLKHALRDHTSSILWNRTFTVAVLHFLRTFNVLLFIPYRTSYAVALLILALVGINLYILKATFLSLVKMARSTAASFQVFLCQYV